MSRPAYIRPEGSFQVDIPDLGTLDFRLGSGEIVFLSEYGDDRTFVNQPLATGPGKIEFKILGESVLLVRWLGRKLYRFDFRTLTLEDVVELARSAEDDHAFMFIRFLDAMERILVIYENGVICLKQDGSLVWHAAHGKYGNELERVDDLGVWYSDAEGNSWAYRWEDGGELGPSNH